MKAYVAMLLHNLKIVYPEHALKFSRNSEKFVKFQGEHPWKRAFSINLQICSAFARIRL